MSGVTDQVEAVALAYWTDQPVRSAGELPLLKISMKSLRKGAFALPPPPKTWEITSFEGIGVAVGEGVGDGFAVGVGSGVGEAVGVGIGVAVGEGDGEGIGVAVGDGEGVGVGVGVGVGGGETRMNTEESSLVPGLKGRFSLAGAVEWREKRPVMSGERVNDWLRSPRKPTVAPYVTEVTISPVALRSVTTAPEFVSDSPPVEALTT